MQIMLGILWGISLITLSAAQQRNILFILADDLGYNDVSWHNPDVISPNLESLAMNGIRLENHYVQPLCTPSRAALMTGYYPIHTGRQYGVLWNEEPKGLYTNFTLLPEYLNRLGYRSHIVGKWHLGYCHEDYLPTNRGFQSFYGYYTSFGDYYNHTTVSDFGDPGYDFRDGDDVAYSANNTYSTYLFADRASQVISDHALNNPDQPLFLYLPFQSVHDPIQVPQEYADLYPEVQDEGRKKFLGMVTAMDDAVGQVVQALRNADMFENTIVIFSADVKNVTMYLSKSIPSNGANPVHGGNNSPLRAGKWTMYEGGTRVSAFINLPFLDDTAGAVHNGLIHMSDWLPTLYSANGGDLADLGDIDGIDQWESISNLAPSPRTEMLYNIWPHAWKYEPVGGVYDNQPGAALRIDNMKLICGDGGTIYEGDRDEVTKSNSSPKEETRRVSLAQSCMLKRLPIQLYDLETDPSEELNLVDQLPGIVEVLLLRLGEYEATMIPIHDGEISPEGNPDNFGGVFSPGWCESEPTVENV